MTINGVTVEVYSDGLQGIPRTGRSPGGWAPKTRRAWRLAKTLGLSAPLFPRYEILWRHWAQSQKLVTSAYVLHPHSLPVGKPIRNSLLRRYKTL